MTVTGISWLPPSETSPGRRLAWRLVAAAVALLIVALVAFRVVWHRAPWSAVPDQLTACGSTYYRHGPADLVVSTALAARLADDSPRGLNLVGQTGGWINARPVYVVARPDPPSPSGCGPAVLLKVSSGRYVYFSHSRD